MASDSNARGDKSFRFNLLACRPVEWLWRSPMFPVAPQGLLLVVMVLLVVNGWGIGPGYEGDELKLLRKTNLTTLAVWGLWWPAIIARSLLCRGEPPSASPRLGRNDGELGI